MKENVSGCFFLNTVYKLHEATNETLFFNIITSCQLLFARWRYKTECFLCIIAVLLTQFALNFLPTNRVLYITKI